MNRDMLGYLVVLCVVLVCCLYYGPYRQLEKQRDAYLSAILRLANEEVVIVQIGSDDVYVKGTRQ